MSTTTTIKKANAAAKPVGKAADKAPVKKPAKPAKPTVSETIAKIRQTYGTPVETAAAGLGAFDTIRKSEEGMRLWITVAVESEKSGQSGRAFGEESGGNPNTRARLLSAAAILREARAAKVPVPFWEAVRSGNGTPAHRAKVLAEVKAGRNPFAGEGQKGRRQSTRKPSTAPKSVVPKVDEWAVVLLGMAKGAPKVETDAANLAAIRAAAVSLVGALDARLTADHKAAKAS